MSKYYGMVLALVFTLGLMGCDSGSKNPVKEAKKELETQQKENKEQIEAAKKTIEEKTEANKEIAKAQQTIEQQYEDKVAKVQAEIADKKKEIDAAQTPAAKGPLQADLNALEEKLKTYQNQIDDIKNKAKDADK